VSSKNGSTAETPHESGDDENETGATLSSIHPEVQRTDVSEEDYEPWLFQTMLNELSERELGRGGARQ
jgi:hypothetical protein